ncbi:MAG: PAS domain-containing protein [Candidatus Eisenbacteria bacterium]|nr:PAS domain-containing protein [Candidatus Eisenbacteria bacterium]MCC7143056.1 PAS domain-containing protein [Candidatus Eisenbacteria bacterium]
MDVPRRVAPGDRNGRGHRSLKPGGRESSLAADRELSLLLLNSLDFGLVALDHQHEILFANRKALEILSTTSERLLHRPIGDVLISRTPGFSLWSDGPFAAEVEGAREVMLQFQGKEYLLELRWLPVAHEDAVVASILAFEDVTETVGELEFQRRVDRFASVGHLSAIIAHEIRNPLTGIRTTIQYVGKKLDPESTLRTDLEDAIKELDRIEQFTTDLLQFSGPKSIQMYEQDLNGILETVLDNLELQAQAANVSIKRDFVAGLPPIPVDADAIRQVFLNLALNAIEAMKDGGQLRVSTSTRRYRSRLAVEVAFHDTGCGIAEEAIEKIFDPFFTTKASGTGLGLSISLQIVREHAGRITVRNRSQGGATFRLSFPARGERPAAGASGAATSAAGTSAAGTSGAGASGASASGVGASGAVASGGSA